jgi:hypothetical protein
MFRALFAPIIRITQNCMCNHWYKSYDVAGEFCYEVVVSRWYLASTPDDGCKEHPKHVERSYSEIKYSLLTAASRWKLIYII